MSFQEAIYFDVNGVLLWSIVVVKSQFCVCVYFFEMCLCCLGEVEIKLNKEFAPHRALECDPSARQ